MILLHFNSLNNVLCNTKHCRRFSVLQTVTQTQRKLRTNKTQNILLSFYFWWSWTGNYPVRLRAWRASCFSTCVDSKKCS